MASDTSSKPSFSRGRKWSIAFDVIVRSVVVLAVVAMVIYLGGRYFHRFYLSSHTRIDLSPRTVSVLKTLTNDVKVTLYYDRDDDLFSTITALLKEYRSINPHITIEPVDYVRDAAEAIRVKNAYKLSATPDKREKDVVIFDCGGHVKVADSKILAQYRYEHKPGGDEREFDRKLVTFNGEMAFTSMLQAVMSPEPLKAYFLQGHGEHDFDSTDELTGYFKFNVVLQQNYIAAVPLSLFGTNVVPPDCNLLIVAGPTTEISTNELAKIQQYLDHSGRLFALFNAATKDRPTGLETILAQWGVVIGNSTVSDTNNTVRGPDLIVRNLGRHPVVNPISRSALHLILPRPVGAKDFAGAPADAPKVEEIAFSGEESVLTDDPLQRKRAYPLIVAVEKGAIKGVITEPTRMIVVGDSYFLGNYQIGSADNRAFADFVVNWLVDRPYMLEGLGPRPVAEFRLNMTRSELRTVQWILLAAMPGGVLLVGGLVWLRRRK